MLVAILNPRIEDMLYLLGNFLVILQVGLGMHCSPFTHTFAYHEWGPVPGPVKLRNRGVV